MWIELIVGFVTIIIVNGWLWNKLTGKPPQPFAMPIIGNFYLCDPDPETGTPPMHNIFQDLSKRYGEIFGFQFGNKYSVVVSSPKAIRECLRDNEDATAGRFVPESMNIVTQGVGVALQPDLERWKKCRGALVGAVTSKRINQEKEETILSEAHDMVCFLRDHQGKSFDFAKHTRRESINVLMRLVCSFRFSKEMTPEYIKIEKVMDEVFKAISAGNPSDYIPLAKLGGSATKFVNNLTAQIEIRDAQLNQWIEYHRQTLDSKGHCRDFTDIMLMEKGEDALNQDEIRSIIWDTMAGGIDTSALSFEWLVYILTNYPEVQDKLHAELDRVVGPNRLPTLDDVEKLTYLNATICELFRMKHFAPFGIPHHTSKGIKICGYNVPKDTQVMFNLFTLHMDPELWEDPTRFDPDRFMPGGASHDLMENYLDSDRVRTKFKETQDDRLFNYLPFGYGKRSCAGFGLGRMIMFLKAATHLHCFKWESEDGKKASLEEAFGVTLTPKKPHPIKVTARPAAKIAKPCPWRTENEGMPGVVMA